jgi:hypothetical protein
MCRVLGAKQQLAEMAVTSLVPRDASNFWDQPVCSIVCKAVCGLGDRRLWIYGDGQHVVRALSPAGGITVGFCGWRRLTCKFRNSVPPPLRNNPWLSPIFTIGDRSGFALPGEQGQSIFSYGCGGLVSVQVSMSTAGFVSNASFKPQCSRGGVPPRG